MIMETKYIFVTGGVVSGLGKGITAASLGRLLKDRGHRITVMKCDPYIKNSSGECFANFFSVEFLNCDLGYNQFLINLTEEK